MTQTSPPVIPSKAPAPVDEARVRADDRAHVFHSWSAQAQIDPLPIASASGSYFTDYSGKRYLDFSSGLVNVNIGHQHPGLVAAIQEQAAKLWQVSPGFTRSPSSEAARPHDAPSKCHVCLSLPGRPNVDERTEVGAPMTRAPTTPVSAAALARPAMAVLSRLPC